MTATPTIDQLAAECERLAAQLAAVLARIPDAENAVSVARAAYAAAQAHVGDRAAKLNQRTPAERYALAEGGYPLPPVAPASEERRAAYTDSLSMLELASRDLEEALPIMNDLYRQRDEAQRRLEYLAGQRSQAEAAARAEQVGEQEQGRIRRLLSGLRGA